MMVLACPPDIARIPPKYYMLTGKIVAPMRCYEQYLVEVLNASDNYFSKLRKKNEKFRYLEHQTQGEDDAASSMYSIDFKLLVEQEKMAALRRQIPRITETDRIISAARAHQEEPLPELDILVELGKYSAEQFEKKAIGNETIKRVIQYTKKYKNIFIYYPYEIRSEKDLPGKAFVPMLKKYLTGLMTFRSRMIKGFDTFVCLKVNTNFYIYQWTGKKFVHVDSVDEKRCKTYMRLKHSPLYRYGGST